MYIFVIEDFVFVFVIVDFVVVKCSFFKKFLDYFNDVNKEKKNKKFDFSVIGGLYYFSDIKFGLGLVVVGLYCIDCVDILFFFFIVLLYGDVFIVGFYLFGVCGSYIFLKDKYWFNYNFYFYFFFSLYWGVGYWNVVNDENESSYKCF